MIILRLNRVCGRGTTCRARTHPASRLQERHTPLPTCPRLFPLLLQHREPAGRPLKPGVLTLHFACLTRGRLQAHRWSRVWLVLIFQSWLRHRRFSPSANQLSPRRHPPLMLLRRLGSRAAFDDHHVVSARSEFSFPRQIVAH